MVNTLGANEELGKSNQIAAPTHISPTPHLPEIVWFNWPMVEPNISAFYNFPCVSYVQW